MLLTGNDIDKARFTRFCEILLQPRDVSVDGYCQGDANGSEQGEGHGQGLKEIDGPSALCVLT
jgi:hypothetical protein